MMLVTYKAGRVTIGGGKSYWDDGGKKIHVHKTILTTRIKSNNNKDIKIIYLNLPIKPHCANYSFNVSKSQHGSRVEFA